MTAREFQVEFERRLILIDPNFKIREKLTSDTIFSFINAYVERFVRNNYLQGDVVEDQSRAQKKNQDALKGLIVRTLLTEKAQDSENLDQSTTRFILPDDYFLYIRSNSYVTSNYKTNGTTSSSDDYLNVTPNKTIREEDIEKIISTYYNKVILRNPYVVLNAGLANDTSAQVYVNVIHDEYTTVDKLDLVYYRKPKPFNVIGVDNVNILDHCELPENVHMEIVEGAVEMFITEAKYRLNTNPNQQQNQ